jgi:hypothetical protein
MEAFMLSWVLMGCFSPVAGEWGFYDVVQSGDCIVDNAESLDGYMSLESNGSEYSFTRYDDRFSCALTGQEFACTSDERIVELEEVSLQVTPAATGEFTSSSAGVLRIDEQWSCTSGSCETYGLSDCTKTLEGSVGLSEAE